MMHDKRHNIQEEIKAAAPTLSELESNPEFNAPEGFFNQMQSAVFAAIESPVVMKPPKQTAPYKWMALAAMLVGAGIYLTLSLNQTTDNTLIGAIDLEQSDNVSELDFYMEIEDDLVYDVYASIENEDIDMESTIDWLMEEGIEYDELTLMQLQEL